MQARVARVRFLGGAFGQGHASGKLLCDTLGPLQSGLQHTCKIPLIKNTPAHCMLTGHASADLSAQLFASPSHVEIMSESLGLMCGFREAIQQIHLCTQTREGRTQHTVRSGSRNATRHVHTDTRRRSDRQTNTDTREGETELEARSIARSRGLALAPPTSAASPLSAAAGLSCTALPTKPLWQSVSDRATSLALRRAFSCSKADTSACRPA